MKVCATHLATVVAAVVATLPASPAWAATAYTVDSAKSTLGFGATQTGAEFDGRFDKFRAQIAFADADLPGSKFEVVVDTASVNTADDERDTVLRGSDLFYVEKYPTARFVTTGFKRRAAGSYEATGKLTIRDVTREVQVPFTLMTVKEAGKSGAWLKGAARLKRLDFGVGQGEWQDTSWVADEVTVKFALHLLPAAAPNVQKPTTPPAQTTK